MLTASSNTHSTSSGAAAPIGTAAAGLPPKPQDLSRVASLAAPSHVPAPGPGPLIGARAAAVRSTTPLSLAAAHAPRGGAARAPAPAPAPVVRPGAAGAGALRQSPSSRWETLGLPTGPGVPLSDLALDRSRRASNKYAQSWFGPETVAGGAAGGTQPAGRRQLNAQEWMEQQHSRSGHGVTGGSGAPQAAEAGFGHAAGEWQAQRGSSRAGSIASNYEGHTGQRPVMRSPPPFLAAGPRQLPNPYANFGQPGTQYAGTAVADHYTDVGGNHSTGYFGAGAAQHTSQPPYAFASAPLPPAHPAGSGRGDAPVMTAVDLARRAVDARQAWQQQQQQQMQMQQQQRQQRQQALYTLDPAGYR